MPIGDRRIYKAKKPTTQSVLAPKTPIRKIMVAIKSLTGEIIIKSFSSHHDSVEYADHAKRLGCEVLIGWGE